MKKNLLFAAVLCAMCCACQQPSPPQSEQKNQVFAEANIDDWQLTANVKTAILSDSRLAPSSRLVSVNSHDGVVTLTGIVANTDDKTQLTEIVKKVQGVKNVINQTTVAGQ
jgi:osmotically-inducible protein OsmY